MLDLADTHGFVGEIFSDNFSPDELQNFCLTKDQINCFNDNGYVSGVNILSEDQVDILCEELEYFFNSNHEGKELWHEYHSNESGDPANVLFHALGSWRLKEGFHDILWNPALTIPAAQLLNGPIRFWHDQLFCKPAKHGGVVSWHQDYSYWTRTKPMSHLTCWIGLDDSDSNNGCLQYVPGSHNWDLLPITGLAGDMEAIKKVLSQDQWERLNNPVPIILKRGEAAFHHPLMVHGSFENNSERQRRALVINTLLDGTLSDSNEELLNGVPVIPKGEKIEGKFFPMLSKPEHIDIINNI